MGAAVVGARYGPVLYVVVAMLLVGATTGALQRYAHASGEAAALRVQRDQLVSNTRSLHAERRQLRATGDSIGLVTDSLSRVLLAQVDVEVAQGDSVRIVVVNRIPPEFRLEVEALDNSRLAAIARLWRVHVNDSTTISRLRAQLLDERRNADEIVAGMELEIDNLDNQVAAFKRVARTSWVRRSVTAGKWAGVGVVMCYFLCPGTPGS